MAFFNIKLAQDVAAKRRHRAMYLQGLSLFVCCKSSGTLLLCAARAWEHSFFTARARLNFV